MNETKETILILPASDPKRLSADPEDKFLFSCHGLDEQAFQEMMLANKAGFSFWQNKRFRLHGRFGTHWHCRPARDCVGTYRALRLQWLDSMNSWLDLGTIEVSQDWQIFPVPGVGGDIFRLTQISS